MAVILTPESGPYQSPLEAGERLGRFIDKACGPGTGIVWAANGNLYPLRAPRRDCDGIGDVAIFEWNKPAPPAPQPTGFWGKVKTFIVGVLEAEGEAQLQQSEAEMAMGNAMAQVIGRALHSHQGDGVGVALDVVGVVLSLALIPTGLGVVGLVGLVGSAFLLGTDSGHTHLR